MTAKKQIKHKISERDAVTNKVLAVFTICIVGIFVLMLIYGQLINASTWDRGRLIARIVLGLSIVGVIASLVKIHLERKRGEDVRLRLTRGLHLLVVFAVMTVVMLTVVIIGYPIVRSYYIILPVLAAYYLIFHSYPREFFVVTLNCGVAAGLLWLGRKALGTTNFRYVAWLAIAAGVVLVVLQVLLLLRTKRVGSSGMVDGKRVKLFQSPHAYAIMYITSLLMLVMVVCGVLLGTQIAYYLMYATFAYLFVCAVYYTVKML